MMEEEKLTLTDIVDEYWSNRILKECLSEEDPVNADKILEDLLRSMNLTRTLIAYRSVKKWYA